MTLTDTGPLFVLIDGDDPNHARCEALLRRLSPPLVTTWPCFVEAMYLLGRDLGHPGQEELWGYIVDGLLIIHEQSDRERTRMQVLMNQYRDLPCDLADASLVVAAETLNIKQIFTLDRHFYAYRTAAGNALELVPG